MDKNNFDIEIKSISYAANCLLNNRIDIGTDNYEMGFYVGLLKAVNIIEAGQIYD